MIDQIINAAKANFTPALVEKQNLSIEQIDKTTEATGSSFKDGLQDMVTSGNIGQLFNVFNGKNDPEGQQKIKGSVNNYLIPALTSKLGVSEEKATSIANTVVPFVISQFTSWDGKVANESDLLSKIGISGNESIVDKITGFFK